MKKLFHKELSLCTQAVTWGLLAAVLLTMIPGYPILVGAFLACLGIFHSFQYTNESNDILYSVLLPVRKADVVRAKYAKVLLFEGIAFGIAALLTVLRMALLGHAGVYVTNPMMNATPYFLACGLLVFTAFNILFVGGFFKTAWKVGMPFLRFGIAAFILIGITEVLHHLPGLTFLNDPAGEKLGVQLGILAAALVIFAAGTWLSCKVSIRRFEKIDL